MQKKAKSVLDPNTQTNQCIRITLKKILIRYRMKNDLIINFNVKRFSLFQILIPNLESCYQHHSPNTLLLYMEAIAGSSVS